MLFQRPVVTVLDRQVTVTAIFDCLGIQSLGNKRELGRGSKESER